jgi:alpha-L-rhamnosidase
MGLLGPVDWRAVWIGAAAGVSSPLIRRDFDLPAAPRRARAYVSGLGYHELHLNGAKVGDHVLSPITTTYDRDPEFLYSDELHPRVLYVVHDVTDQVSEGPNAIGLMLGHGWYSAEADVGTPPGHHKPYGDRARALAQLEIELVTGELIVVATDGTWRTSSGPMTYNDYYQGERYEARLEQPGWNLPGFDDMRWSPAVELGPLAGVLRAQLMPPIQVVETRMPQAVSQPRPGTTIVDFGQNMSGWTRINVSGEAGTEVTIRHGARLTEDGDLDNSSSLATRWGDYEARQADTYVLKGGGPEIWEPRFTLHGFRCAEVTSTAPVSLDGVEARVVHANIEQSGDFECADPLLNRIHANVCWTFRASLQGFVQDAADRSERVGWLGDPGFIVEDVLYNFNLDQAHAKWLDDIADIQLANGNIAAVVAPLHWRGVGGLGPVPDWKATFVLIVWQHFQFYGDRSILECHYDGARRFVDLLVSQAERLILTTGIGDHMEPQPDGTCSVLPLRTPVALTSTAWFHACTRIVARIAAELGDDERARRYTVLADKIRDAFNATFWTDEMTGYGPGTQTALALPLWLDLVPADRREAVIDLLIGAIRRTGGNLDTGIIGTAALEQVLADAGAADVMFDIATQTTYPSWGYQVEHGATTLWETWGDNPPDGSLNMKMFGGIEKFFYKDVAGISPAAPGWKEILVKPVLTHRLDHARASVRTPRGIVSIQWRWDGGRLLVDLEIPSTSRAEVWLPLGGSTTTVSEGQQVVWHRGRGAPSASIGPVRHVGDALRLEIGGGSYAFAMSG